MIKLKIKQEKKKKRISQPARGKPQFKYKTSAQSVLLMSSLAVRTFCGLALGVAEKLITPCYAFCFVDFFFVFSCFVFFFVFSFFRLFGARCP